MGRGKTSSQNLQIAFRKENLQYLKLTKDVPNHLVEAMYLIRHLAWKYSKEPDNPNRQYLRRNLDYSFYKVYTENDRYQVSYAIDRRAEKKKRINRYLRAMFDCYSQMYFVTLTFNDKAMLNTTDRTRHRYASSFLNAISYDYLANVDYGDKSHREHYHAVVKLKKGLKDDIFLSWEYGFVNFKLIDTSKLSSMAENKNRRKITSYIIKLSNHAGKLTTGKAFHKRLEKTVAFSGEKIALRELDPDKELPF